MFNRKSKIYCNFSLSNKVVTGIKDVLGDNNYNQNKRHQKNQHGNYNNHHHKKHNNYNKNSLNNRHNGHNDKFKAKEGEIERPCFIQREGNLKDLDNGNANKYKFREEENRNTNERSAPVKTESKDGPPVFVGSINKTVITNNDPRELKRQEFKKKEEEQHKDLDQIGMPMFINSKKKDSDSNVVPLKDNSDVSLLFNVSFIWLK